MKTEPLYHDLIPRVVPVRQTVSLTVRPRDRHAAFPAGQPVYVHLIPMEGGHPGFSPPGHPVLEAWPQEGALRFDALFPTEQEYSLILCNSKEYWAGGRKISLQLYALEPDLLALRPLRGCTHAHSHHSDGVESPEMVAACYREIGFDFLAITDHHRYQPSLEAMAYYRDLAIDMTLLPGEEVHPPQNPIHIVNFGGDFSVNDWMKDHPRAYQQEVAAIQTGLQVPPGVNGAHIASCTWAFRKIREGGGIAILCHPNWTMNGAYNIPQAVYQYFLHHVDYDALELFNGGNSPAENQLQLAAWYNTDPAVRPPVLAADDAHGCVNGAWFDIAKTYVLAKSRDAEDIKAAIRQGLCVAAERFHGESSRVHGPLRLVKYFTFLEREYFPRHDALCREEGRLMLAHIAGEPDAKARLEALSGQTGRLYTSLWATA